MADEQPKPRTTQIPINSAPKTRLVFGESNYHLNIEPAHNAAESVQKNKSTTLPAASAKKVLSKISTAPLQKLQNKLQDLRTSKVPLPKVKSQIWHWLEWLSTSAAIFIVLFFVINWSSYSMLFKSKLDQLKGQVQSNPYISQLTKEKASAPETQKPLPIVTNPETAKKQIPPINLNVAPPDDRIIIERINKNVPIVRVSTEKLIQKDWGALEKEIQNALQEGVVHYPGTAQPGERGNVVITGHSSYFPWDPGRFKDVFALLTQVNVGDKVLVYHDQKAYTYQVYEKKIVTPDHVEVLTQKGEDRLTLITCYPVGTNQKRLVVFARPV